jgi:hypothetical protein
MLKASFSISSLIFESFPIKSSTSFDEVSGKIN